MQIRYTFEQMQNNFTHSLQILSKLDNPNDHFSYLIGAPKLIENYYPEFKILGNVSTKNEKTFKGMWLRLIAIATKTYDIAGKLELTYLNDPIHHQYIGEYLSYLPLIKDPPKIIDDVFIAHYQRHRNNYYLIVMMIAFAIDLDLNETEEIEKFNAFLTTKENSALSFKDRLHYFTTQYITPQLEEEKYGAVVYQCSLIVTLINENRINFINESNEDVHQIITEFITTLDELKLNNEENAKNISVDECCDTFNDIISKIEEIKRTEPEEIKTSRKKLKNYIQCYMFAIEAHLNQLKDKNDEKNEEAYFALTGARFEIYVKLLNKYPISPHPYNKDSLKILNQATKIEVITSGHHCAQGAFQTTLYNKRKEEAVKENNISTFISSHQYLLEESINNFKYVQTENEEKYYKSAWRLASLTIIECITNQCFLDSKKFYAPDVDYLTYNYKRMTKLTNKLLSAESIHLSDNQFLANLKECIRGFANICDFSPNNINTFNKLINETKQTVQLLLGDGNHGLTFMHDMFIEVLTDYANRVNEFHAVLSHYDVIIHHKNVQVEELMVIKNELASQYLIWRDLSDYITREIKLKSALVSSKHFHLDKANKETHQDSIIKNLKYIKKHYSALFVHSQIAEILSAAELDLSNIHVEFQETKTNLDTISTKLAHSKRKKGTKKEVTIETNIKIFSAIDTFIISILKSLSCLKENDKPTVHIAFEKDSLETIIENWTVLYLSQLCLKNKTINFKALHYISLLLTSLLKTKELAALSSSQFGSSFAVIKKYQMIALNLLIQQPELEPDEKIYYCQTYIQLADKISKKQTPIFNNNDLKIAYVELIKSLLIQLQYFNKDEVKHIIQSNNKLISLIQDNIETLSFDHQLKLQLIRYRHNRNKMLAVEELTETERCSNEMTLMYENLLRTVDNLERSTKTLYIILLSPNPDTSMPISDLIELAEKLKKIVTSYQVGSNPININNEIYDQVEENYAKYQRCSQHLQQKITLFNEAENKKIEAIREANQQLLDEKTKKSEGAKSKFEKTTKTKQNIDILIPLIDTNIVEKNNHKETETRLYEDQLNVTNLTINIEKDKKTKLDTSIIQETITLNIYARLSREQHQSEKFLPLRKEEATCIDLTKFISTNKKTNLKMSHFDCLYEIDSFLEEEKCKLQLTGGIAVLCGIMNVNPLNAEFFLTLNDIDVKIPRTKKNMRSISSHLIENGFQFSSNKKNNNRHNLSKIIDGVNLDATVYLKNKLSLPFIVLCMCHLTFIKYNDEQYKQAIATNQRIFKIGPYYLLLHIRPGFEEAFKNACLFLEFLVMAPDSSYSSYCYTLAKYDEKAHLAAPLLDTSKRLTTTYENLIAYDDVFPKLITQFREQLTSKIPQEQIKPFLELNTFLTKNFISSSVELKTRVPIMAKYVRAFFNAYFQNNSTYNEFNAKQPQDKPRFILSDLIEASVEHFITFFFPQTKYNKMEDIEEFIEKINEIAQNNLYKYCVLEPLQQTPIFEQTKNDDVDTKPISYPRSHTVLYTQRNSTMNTQQHYIDLSSRGLSAGSRRKYTNFVYYFLDPADKPRDDSQVITSRGTTAK